MRTNYICYRLSRKKHHLVSDAFFLACPTGFEPAISSVTGRRDNHFTTSTCSGNRGHNSKLTLPAQGLHCYVVARCTLFLEGIKESGNWLVIYDNDAGIDLSAIDTINPNDLAATAR